MGSVSLKIGDGTARFKGATLCSSAVNVLMLFSVLTTHLFALYAFTASILGPAPLGYDGVADAFQLLHLVLKLVRLSKLVRIQPLNCLLNGSFNLLLVIWAKLGTDLLILDGVTHVVGIVFQCILGLNFLLVALMYSSWLFVDQVSKGSH